MVAKKKKAVVTYLGTGRRKSSVASVYLTPGTGIISVNDKTLDEYLPLETLRMVVRSPLVLTETLSTFALGLVLFIVTLILNMISLSLIRKFKEKYKVNTL